MMWLWNQGDGVKQPRSTDTHNTLINRHCMGGGRVFLCHSHGGFPPNVLLGRKKEGGGGEAGFLNDQLSKYIAAKDSGYRIYFDLQTNPCSLR